MFHAINAGKASIHRIVEGTKQPREDLVTSALFGTIEFLTDHGRRRALQTLIDWTGAGTPSIHLWPRFARGNGWIEPDVVISSVEGGRWTYWLVEVKWGAALGAQQAADEIEAVRLSECIRCGSGMTSKIPRPIGGFILLGKEAQHQAQLDALRLSAGELKSVAWHEATGRLRGLIASEKVNPTDTGLVRWAVAAEAFLSSTSKGRKLGPWPNLKGVRKGCINFR